MSWFVSNIWFSHLKSILDFPILSSNNILNNSHLLLSGCKVSRILAGYSLQNKRKEYLNSSNINNLSLNDNIYGLGLSSYPLKTKGYKYYISIWDIKSVKTFYHENTSQEFSPIIQEFLLLLQQYNNNISYDINNISLIYNENIEKEITKIQNKESNFIIISSSGDLSYSFPKYNNINKKPFILSGSFNPLHQGHVDMLNKTSNYIRPQAEKYFELSIYNADKPVLSLNSILDRIIQFIGGNNIIISTKPYFIDKARLYKPISFIIGYDTAIRIINEKYYTNKTIMINELENLRKMDCDFIVCGRTVNNEYKLYIPLIIDNLFSFIPKNIFYLNISSTEIRNKGIKVPDLI